MASAPWIVSDELWSRIEPLLPRVERQQARNLSFTGLLERTRS